MAGKDVHEHRKPGAGCIAQAEFLGRHRVNDWQQQTIGAQLSQFLANGLQVGRLAVDVLVTPSPQAPRAPGFDGVDLACLPL